MSRSRDGAHVLASQRVGPWTVEIVRGLFGPVSRIMKGAREAREVVEGTDEPVAPASARRMARFLLACVSEGRPVPESAGGQADLFFG